MTDNAQCTIISTRLLCPRTAVRIRIRSKSTFISIMHHAPVQRKDGSSLLPKYPARGTRFSGFLGESGCKGTKNTNTNQTFIQKNHLITTKFSELLTKRISVQSEKKEDFTSNAAKSSLYYINNVRIRLFPASKNSQQIDKEIDEVKIQGQRSQ